MAHTPYTKAYTFTVPGEWTDFMARGDAECLDAMLTDYVWDSVSEAQERVRIMVQINRFPYHRYETREGVVYAFTEAGQVQTVIFLERRSRPLNTRVGAAAMAARPQPTGDAWEGFSGAWGAGMRVDLYRDSATGSWAVLTRVWNTWDGSVAVNQTEWFDEDYESARRSFRTMRDHYTQYNG